MQCIPNLRAFCLRLFWMLEIMCDKTEMAVNMEEKSTKITKYRKTLLAEIVIKLKVLEVQSLLKGSMKNTCFVLISPRLLLMAAVAAVVAPQTKYQMSFLSDTSTASLVSFHIFRVCFTTPTQKSKKVINMVRKCCITLITLRIAFPLNLDLISNQN